MPFLLVLPRRIELRTSPLPRECSTTELRQRRGPAEPAADLLPHGNRRIKPGARGIGYNAAMSDDRGDEGKAAARKAREARLAAALRANLRRRKAGGGSTAGSADEPAPETPGEAGSGADDGGK